MQITGADIARQALRKIGVIDPEEPGSDELIADTLVKAATLLDTWRTDRLTMSGALRSVFNLVGAQASYTIGVGGEFNQAYPQSIDLWSIIPLPAAANPNEIPYGRPLTYAQWQLVQVKNLQGSWPTQMYFDKSWAAGLGRCYFYPVPQDATPDVVIYSFVPEITAILPATTYDLHPGMTAAVILNLALEAAEDQGVDVTPSLYARAKEALGAARRAAIIPVESRIRPEWAIGSNERRTLNIYTDS